MIFIFILDLDCASSQDEDSKNINHGIRERLDSYNRNSVSTEDMLGTYVAVEDKYRCKEWSNPDLLGDSGQYKKLLQHSENNNLVETNVTNFKKKHRRMHSLETVKLLGHKADARVQDSSPKSNNTPSVLSDESSSPMSTSKDSEDEYNDGYRQWDMSELMNQASKLASDELPDGWSEVRDGNEVYYWHIWTGTIQYERPTISLVGCIFREGSFYCQLITLAEQLLSARQFLDPVFTQRVQLLSLLLLAPLICPSIYLSKF